MKKRIIAIVISVLMLFATVVSASAADQKIGFDSVYNAGTGLVEVTVYIDDAVGVQATDLCLAFDETMYVFSHFDANDETEAVIAAGESQISAKGLVKFSCIFLADAGASEDDVDSNGRLTAATYYFKPLNDNYDAEEFFLWADSFAVNDIDISGKINTQGNPELKDGRQAAVTMPDADDSAADKKAPADDKNNSASEEGVNSTITVGAAEDTDEEATTEDKDSEDEADKDEDSDDEKASTKWYIYVIIAVAGAGIVACVVAIIVVSVKKQKKH